MAKTGLVVSAHSADFVWRAGGLIASAAAAPARRPTRIDDRATGDATSRSKNPFSMSSATSEPATTAPNMTPWIMVAGNKNWPNDWMPG